MNRVIDAVTVAGSRFKPGPHQYVVRPPWGDGTTTYPTREAALDAYDQAEEERNEHHPEAGIGPQEARSTGGSVGSYWTAER